MGKGGNKKDDQQQKKVSLEELDKHRTPKDAWIAYDGKVYDVTSFGEQHPGGSVIFTMAGDDCTDIFNAFHPLAIGSDMASHTGVVFKGALDDSITSLSSSASAVEHTKAYKNKFKPEKQKQFELAYRKLRNDLIKDKMFESDKLYYLWKVLSTFSIFVLSVYVAWRGGLLNTIIGGVILGLFWQQSGWLAHDFLHHQVFKNRNLNNISALMIANIWQGFSGGWWKSKHNKHHAVPNLLSSKPDADDGDPDIDTLPVLSWHQKMSGPAKDSAFAGFMIKWQKYLYFPILFGARLTWAHQSWNFVFGGFQLYGHDSAKYIHIDKKISKLRNWERLGLVIHYAGIIYVCSKMSSLWLGLLWFMLGQTMCGLFLAVVFGLGHNGMAVYPADERPDFWKLQVTTTRNVTSNWFVDWFCGGLQYQVDHHLFPSLPRHNLKRVHEKVAKFCKEEGVEYHEANMWDGTIEVLKHLEEVTEHFVKDFPAT